MDPDNGARYILVPGSSTRQMVWGFEKKKVIAVIESELDVVLVKQEAGDLIGIVALGSVSLRPDVKTHEALTRMEFLLVFLDLDGPEASESHRFWITLMD